MRKRLVIMATLLAVAMAAIGCGKNAKVTESIASEVVEETVVAVTVEETSTEETSTGEPTVEETESTTEEETVAEVIAETEPQVKTEETVVEAVVEVPAPTPEVPTPTPELTEAPVLETPASAEPVVNQTPQVQAPVVAPAGVIMIGDSRCVQMRDAVGGGGCTWICENGKRYEWFEQVAIPRADAVVGKGTKVVICMGVNDTGDATKYAALTNAYAANWAARGARTYYVSVNPVLENPYTTEESVVNFNNTIIGQLMGVRWIDTHTFLQSAGFKMRDGLHYDNDTNVKIFYAIIGSL